MRRISRNKLSIRFVKNSTAAFILVVLLLVVLFARSFLTGVWWRVGAPLLSARAVLLAPVSFLATAFDAKASLEAENVRLRAALASTTALVADRDLLYAENLELKNRLGQDAHLHSVLGAVLLRPPELPYDTLLIDVGTAQGVALGDQVSAGGSTMIGRIIEVHPTTATVELFSAPSTQYEALLLHGAASSTRSSIPIVLEGQGGGSLKAEVPAGTPVAKGDAIVSSGIVEGYAGSVSAVEQKESESFETIYATLPVNPLELRFVEVRLP